MGLDMYLEADKFISQYSDKGLYDNLEKVLGYPVKGITREVGYWRKANAIHHWFVMNVQNGEDDCQRSYVESEKLIELRDHCIVVRDDNSLAQRLLPVQAGFFFGGTDYDVGYFMDINNTIRIIDEIENDDTLRSCDLYYRASW